MLESAEDVMRSSEKMRTAANKLFSMSDHMPREIASVQHHMIMDMIDMLEEHRMLLMAYSKKIERL